MSSQTRSLALFTTQSCVQYAWLVSCDQPLGVMWPVAWDQPLGVMWYACISVPSGKPVAVMWNLLPNELLLHTLPLVTTVCTRLFITKPNKGSCQEQERSNSPAHRCILAQHQDRDAIKGDGFSKNSAWAMPCFEAWPCNIIPVNC